MSKHVPNLIVRTVLEALKAAGVTGTTGSLSKPRLRYPTLFEPGFKFVALQDAVSGAKTRIEAAHDAITILSPVSGAQTLPVTDWTAIKRSIDEILVTLVTPAARTEVLTQLDRGSVAAPPPPMNRPRRAFQ